MIALKARSLIILNLKNRNFYDPLSVAPHVSEIIRGNRSVISWHIVEGSELAINGTDDIRPERSSGHPGEGQWS